MILFYKSESNILLGDFNAHVKADNETQEGVTRKHGIAGAKRNGQYLLQLCSSNELSITNAFFQNKDIH